MNALDSRADTVETMLIALLREHQLSVESLTQAQFIEALKQAIASGDFQRCTIVDSDAQTVTYKPYRRVQELEAKIAALTQPQSALA